MYPTEIHFLFIIISVRQGSLQPSNCDLLKQTNLKESNIGETKIFPWLGVLRVHIHEENSFQVAATGIVLVKTKYCIANANDVSKMSAAVIRREGKAMFILNDNETWSCDVQIYSIHPEYDYATHNTIALLELDEEYRYQLPLPVCWQEYTRRDIKHLYLLGYTDENQILEKFMYKVDYINQSVCDEFYNRIGFKNELYKPTSYICALAKNNKKDCVLENGTALVSNNTGNFVLVGFGIKGPGCAGPSRFIDISAYVPWIQSSTDQIRL